MKRAFNNGPVIVIAKVSFLIACIALPKIAISAINGNEKIINLIGSSNKFFLKMFIDIHEEEL